jgi:hypothetical protein
MTDPVICEIEVPCAPDRAFDVFVHRMADWWPLDSHSASARFEKPALTVTIEPRVGGKVHETMHDGGTDLWGEVLVYDPPAHFAMTWHPGNNKDAPTRVDVAFVALGGGGCRVKLTHSGWQAWGDRADEVRNGYDVGWAQVFGVRFASACVG